MVLSVGLLLEAALVQSACGSKPAELKLGYIGDFSDPDDTFSQTAKLALEDRVKEVNAKGGINGMKVQLIPYDVKGNLDNAADGTRKLIEQDHVAGIVGPGFSAGTFSLGTIAEAARVPIIATTATDPRVTQNEGGSVKPYMFRASFTDPYQAAILADFAFKDLNKRKAAFIYGSDYPYPGVILKHFEAEFARLGGQVVAKEGFNWGNKDFKNQLTNVAKAKPDCLVIATAAVQDISRITQQAQAMGLKFQYLGPDGWANNDLLPAAGKLLEGSYLTTGVSAGDPKFADFNAQFKQAHNRPCDISSYYTLDAFMAMEYAARASLDKAGKIDPAVMRNSLETMKDVPVFTGHLTMDPATHNPFNRPMLIVTIKDGQWRTFKTFQAQ